MNHAFLVGWIVALSLILSPPASALMTSAGSSLATSHFWQHRYWRTGTYDCTADAVHRGIVVYECAWTPAGWVWAPVV